MRILKGAGIIFGCVALSGIIATIIIWLIKQLYSMIHFILNYLEIFGSHVEPASVLITIVMVVAAFVISAGILTEL